jgi:hypothetical protein
VTAEDHKAGDRDENEGEDLDAARDVDELEREVGVEDDDCVSWGGGRSLPMQTMVTPAMATPFCSHSEPLRAATRKMYCARTIELLLLNERRTE